MAHPFGEERDVGDIVEAICKNFRPEGSDDESRGEGDHPVEPEGILEMRPYSAEQQKPPYDVPVSHVLGQLRLHNVAISR